MSKTELSLDRYGRAIYSCDDLCHMLMAGKDIDEITQVIWSDDAEKYNNAVTENYDEFSKLTPLPTLNIEIEEYDKQNQQHWFLPVEYNSVNISDYVRELTPDDPVYSQRVEAELDLYDKYDLLDVLKVCMYIATTAKKNNIPLGVGRGSSVSSYVLYLLGIHKIDSVKYNLDINEFLK